MFVAFYYKMESEKEGGCLVVYVSFMVKPTMLLTYFLINIAQLLLFGIK